MSAWLSFMLLWLQGMNSDSQVFFACRSHSQQILVGCVLQLAARVGCKCVVVFHRVVVFFGLPAPAVLCIHRPHWI